MISAHKGLRVTSAMTAGVSNTLRNMEWIDARTLTPNRRKTYRALNPIDTS